MDNGMGGNGVSNGILMEDEILDTPAVSTPSQAAPQQTVQPQQMTQPQYGTTAQPMQQTAVPPQYGTTTQTAQSQDNAVAQQRQAVPVQPNMQPQYGAVQSQYGAVQSQQPNMQSQYRAMQSQQPTIQPQYGSAASQGYTASAQPNMQPQQATVPQQAAAAQSGQAAAGMEAFNNAPSFDSMDGMNMGSNVMSSEAFGSSTGATSTGWEDQNSDSAFRGSVAGRNMSTDNVVIRESVSSNIFLGLIGAVIGALIGAVLWVIIYQLGYVAGIAGAAIIGFSIKGYAILGRGLDVKGVILCALLSIVTIYFAHRVSFAIVYMTTMNETWNASMDFKTAYTGLDDFMKMADTASEAIGSSNSVTAAYWRDLFVGYVLSAVVGIPMAIRMIGKS